MDPRLATARSFSVAAATPSPVDAVGARWPRAIPGMPVRASPRIAARYVPPPSSGSERGYVEAASLRPSGPRWASSLLPRGASASLVAAHSPDPSPAAGAQVVRFSRAPSILAGGSGLRRAPLPSRAASSLLPPGQRVARASASGASPPGFSEGSPSGSTEASSSVTPLWFLGPRAREHDLLSACQEGASPR